MEKWAKHVLQVREHLMAADPKATLTALYNDVVKLRAAPDATHPTNALKTAHDHLNKAVAAAYGWTSPLEDDELVGKLFELNKARQATSPTTQHGV